MLEMNLYEKNVFPTMNPNKVSISERYSKAPVSMRINLEAGFRYPLGGWPADIYDRVRIPQYSP